MLRHIGSLHLEMRRGAQKRREGERLAAPKATSAVSIPAPATASMQQADEMAAEAAAKAEAKAAADAITAKKDAALMDELKEKSAAVVALLGA